MYTKKYYEITPNVETISNQSQSFYYPVQVSISDHLLQDYNYENDNDEIIIEDYFPNMTKEDIHSLLDYTMLSDEFLINLQMLFSEIPNKEEYNLVQFIKSRGIIPNPNAVFSEKEV